MIFIFLFYFSLEILRNCLLPFKIKFSNQNINNNHNFQNNKFSYDPDKNLLTILNNEDPNELINTIKILNNFALLERNKSNGNYSSAQFFPTSSSLKKLKIFKHINLFYLVHEEEDFKEYSKFSSQLISLTSTKLNIFVKFLFYDKFKGVVNSDNLYGELKNYNSKLTFEELNDEDSLNLILLNDKSKRGVEVYYNKDINNDIFVLNLEKDINNENFEKIISIRSLDYEIKTEIKFNSLYEISKMINSKHFKFGKLLIKSLNNLEKINKIFGLYDSIRTFESVKLKVSCNFINFLNIISLSLMTSKPIW